MVGVGRDFKGQVQLMFLALQPGQWPGDKPVKEEGLGQAVAVAQQSWGLGGSG